MELSRRDAVLALATLGVTGGAIYGRMGRRERVEDDERTIAILTAIAEVVYPSEVSGIPEFVEPFVRGRLSQPEHGDGMRTTAAEVDRLAKEWHGASVVDLGIERRDRLLREIGADTAEEVPSGTTAERVRYYLINDLLLGLYTSPTGGELIGLENPPGFAGGTESYARGPSDGR